MMQERGVEPLHLAVQDPKSCASASSATPAWPPPLARNGARAAPHCNPLPARILIRNRRGPAIYGPLCAPGINGRWWRGGEAREWTPGPKDSCAPINGPAVYFPPPHEFRAPNLRLATPTAVVLAHPRCRRGFDRRPNGGSHGHDKTSREPYRRGHRLHDLEDRLAFRDHVRAAHRGVAA